MTAHPPLRDRLGAFCTHSEVRRAGRSGRPLSGLRFAAKDVFQIAGETACYGNPTWLRTHDPSNVTAEAVDRLVDAGAALVGMTRTDELALSLTGENAHYGTPMNPRCPDRVPGGSSSGSAVAVAGELVDFALGTDTGGSVRVPASHTGVFGMRPTWGAVSTRGVLPLASRFDTVGWFARDPDVLARVGAVLLPRRPPAHAHAPLVRLVVPLDAEAAVDPGAWTVFREAAERLANALRVPLEWASPPPNGPELSTWAGVYLPLQNQAIAGAHRDFAEREHPEFGSLIGGRFERALAVTTAEVALAEGLRESIVRRIAGIFARSAWLVLPSAAGAAPFRGQDDAVVNAVTGRSLALSAAAGLGGLPQVSLPLAMCDGRCPLGISLVGPPGSDTDLLDATCRAVSRLARSPS